MSDKWTTERHKEAYRELLETGLTEEQCAAINKLACRSAEYFIIHTLRYIYGEVEDEK